MREIKREIKFRAWDKENKEMFDVFQLTKFVDGEYIASKYIESIKDTRSYKTPPLMQYTGIKDKNGVEIYDGDIVNDGFLKHKVDFSSGMFHISLTPLSKWSKEIEVIGNVWENPELIKD